MNAKQVESHARKCARSYEERKREEHAHRISMLRIEYDGLHAYDAGQTENPYSLAEGKERAAWLRGWNNAANSPTPKAI